MTNLQSLSVFVTERLTLAAQEIFKAVEVTVTEYHEEISRSRQENELLKRRLLEAGIDFYSELQPSLSVVQESEPSVGQPVCGEPWNQQNEKIQVKLELSAAQEETQDSQLQIAMAKEPLSPKPCLQNEQKMEEMFHVQTTDGSTDTLLPAGPFMQIKEEPSELVPDLRLETFCESQTSISADPSSALASSHCSGFEEELDSHRLSSVHKTVRSKMHHRKRRRQEVLPSKSVEAICEHQVKSSIDGAIPVSTAKKRLWLNPSLNHVTSEKNRDEAQDLAVALGKLASRHIDFTSAAKHQISFEDNRIDESKVFSRWKITLPSQTPAIMEAILSLIKTTLPSLSEVLLQSLVQRLDFIGVASVEDLGVVTDADLEGILQPMQCRRLIQAFQTGPFNNIQIPVEPSAIAQSSGEITGHFQIPLNKFPPELIKAMKEQTRPHPSLRREMVRIIINDLLAVERKRPGRGILRQIAQELVQKYPKSFCDVCGDDIVGTGFNSLMLQMENRVDNCSRHVTVRSKRPAEGDAGAKKPKRYDRYGCVQWPPDLPATEDTPSQIDKKMDLQNSYAKKKLPETCVKKLMAETYCSQRLSINIDNKTVSELKNEWPYLFEATHFFDHTERLLGIPVQRKLAEELSKKGRTIVNFLMQTKVIQFTVMEEMLKDPLKLLSSIGRYLGDNTEVLLIQKELPLMGRARVARHKRCNNYDTVGQDKDLAQWRERHLMKRSRGISKLIKVGRERKMEQKIENQRVLKKKDRLPGIMQVDEAQSLPTQFQASSRNRNEEIRKHDQETFEMYTSQPQALGLVGPNTCVVCGRTFSSRGLLKIHLRVHSGEKPYHCPFCDKNFRQSSHLSVHVRIHTGEKPYSCLTCGKRFSDRSACNRHVRAHLENDNP